MERKNSKKNIRKVDKFHTKIKNNKIGNIKSLLAQAFYLPFVGVITNRKVKNKNEYDHYPIFET